MFLPLGSPDAIEALAARVARDADRLAAGASGLRVAASNAGWEAPRAEHWRAGTGRRAARAEQVAEDLRAVARELRRTAETLRAEYRVLATIEDRVRDFIDNVADALVGEPSPWEGTRWTPANLPDPGDPAWRSVARDLGLR